MATPIPPPVAGSAEQAMNRVLAAERDAKKATAECEAQAAETVEATRQQARHIAERTDRRISRLHADCELATARRIELLLRQEQGTGAEHAALPHEEEVLVAAVERLATLLTGAAPPQHGNETE